MGVLVSREISVLYDSVLEVLYFDCRWSRSSPQRCLSMFRCCSRIDELKFTARVAVSSVGASYGRFGVAGDLRTIIICIMYLKYCISTVGGLGLRLSDV